VPEFSRAPHDCSAIRILTSTCAGSVSRAAVDGKLRRAVAAEDSAAVATTATWAIGFENEICGSKRCSTVRDGTIRYRDRDHLSVEGALALTSRFEHVILRRARPRASS